MMSFCVVYYETNQGRAPAEEFILAQDSKMQAKIFKMLELLEEYGNLLGLPYSEYLDDGIFELRIKLGTNITRVLYFFMEGNRIVLTNGFVKKTQKTPPNEIVLAKKHRDDYYSQRGMQR